MLKLHFTFSWYYSTRQLPVGLATVHGVGLLTEMHAMGGHRPNTSFFYVMKCSGFLNHAQFLRKYTRQLPIRAGHCHILTEIYCDVPGSP